MAIGELLWNNKWLSWGDEGIVFCESKVNHNALLKLQTTEIVITLKITEMGKLSEKGQLYSTFVTKVCKENFKESSKKEIDSIMSIYNVWTVKVKRMIESN